LVRWGLDGVIGCEEREGLFGGGIFGGTVGRSSTGEGQMCGFLFGLSLLLLGAETTGFFLGFCG
jgi:hypothetical protein